jgi:2-phospho-L-lactate guanylyltransferase (CobY/MobA/RfbA family)
MRLIRSRLNPKLKAREEKHYFVPEILNDIVKELQFFLENIGFVVIDIKSIQYGKKISLQLGNKRAEINLFFGKRGFSVVQTSKSGTSSDLNQLGADCIKQFLLENAYF